MESCRAVATLAGWIKQQVWVKDNMHTSRGGLPSEVGCWAWVIAGMDTAGWSEAEVGAAGVQAEEASVVISRTLRVELGGKGGQARGADWWGQVWYDINCLVLWSGTSPSKEFLRLKVVIVTSISSAGRGSCSGTAWEVPGRRG